MSALTVTLGADITALKRALAGATELVSASARRMGGMTGAGLAGLGKGGAVALGKGFEVSGIALKAGIGAALAGGAAAMGVGVKAVTSAADFEQTKVAFTTLIGDAAKAEETLAKLRQLGAETPFEFPELADAGRKLIAFGESADTVPETLRRIGDVSAGVQAPVNEIAELYGKARVQGRLFAEDINPGISRRAWNGWWPTCSRACSKSPAWRICWDSMKARRKPTSARSSRTGRKPAPGCSASISRTSPGVPGTWSARVPRCLASGWLRRHGRRANPAPQT
ncbi:MAG: hypothetical protein NTW21_29160 [Verrucomicrobia bacterium]|nr:hypothetical protein [Verrucomicrobiota bacterium]